MMNMSRSVSGECGVVIMRKGWENCITVVLVRDMGGDGRTYA